MVLVRMVNQSRVDFTNVEREKLMDITERQNYEKMFVTFDTEGWRLLRERFIECLIRPIIFS